MIKRILPPIFIFIVSVAAIVPLMSFGAEGSDSPGYIWLAGRISHNEPLIQNDSTYDILLQVAPDEARSLKIAEPKQQTLVDGKMVHNYPIGLSLLMSLVYLATQSPLGWYVSYILIVALAPMLLYLVVKELLHEVKYNSAMATLAALSLLTQTTYF